MLRRLKALGELPLTWLAAYVALVPLVATVYWALPARSFHDANIEFEAPVKRDGAKLAGSLTSVINARAQATTWRFQGTRFAFAPKQGEVEKIYHTRDGRLLLLYAGYFTGEHGFGRFTQWFWVPLDESLHLGDALRREPVDAYPLLPVDRTGSSWVSKGPHPLYSYVFPPPSLTLPTPPSDSAQLVVPPSVNRQLIRFSNAVEGDPKYASGLWARMLYFSATTITTLGLGDLTPVSGTARLFVGAEAVAGIIVIGLFLNALSGGALIKALTMRRTS